MIAPLILKYIRVPRMNDYILPENGQICIQALKKESKTFNGVIKDIRLLGFDQNISWSQTPEGLMIETGLNIKTDEPVCLKLTID